MMQPSDSALLFSDLPGALARSKQMAGSMKCDGTHTVYWYECIQLTDGQGAMIVHESGPYGAKPGPTALSQLTPKEIAALQPYSAVESLLPPPPTPIGPTPPLT